MATLMDRRVARESLEKQAGNKGPVRGRRHWERGGRVAEASEEKDMGVERVGACEECTWGGKIHLPPLLDVGPRVAYDCCRSLGDRLEMAQKMIWSGVKSVNYWRPHVTGHEYL